MTPATSIGDLVCNNCIWSKDLETGDRLNDFGRPLKKGINCHYHDKQVHKDSFCKDGQWIVQGNKQYSAHDRPCAISFLLNTELDR